MRLELGRRADYGIRAIVDLARYAHHPQRRTTRVIAEAMDIPVGYLPQILAELVRAELAISVPGRDGGYHLARDPHDIDLLEVLQAVDGEPRSTVCVLRGGPCRWDDRCAVHDPWSRAQEAMLQTLSSTTLADVVANGVTPDVGTHVAADGFEPTSSWPPHVGFRRPERDQGPTAPPKR